MLRQHMLQRPARMARGMLHHLLRRARPHDLSTLISAFWTEIDHPDPAVDPIKIVLVYLDEIALIDKALHHTVEIN